jgi:hypothetical protein
MKKGLFIIAACLTIAFGFTSCKDFGTAEVTLSVVDYDGFPIANRKIYYTEEASFWASIIAPAPDAPFNSDDIDDLQWLETNAAGVVTHKILSNLEYGYFVLDEAVKDGYLFQSVKLKKDEKKEIVFKVNK